LSRAQIGASYYKEKTNDNEDLKAAGGDILVEWKGFKLQSEYAKGFFDPDVGGSYHRTGYYGQLEYNLRKWTMGYRFDWYDPDNSIDNDRKTINTVALNYHFTPYVVGKIENHWVDTQDTNIDNYYLTIFSIAAYLGR
jgi:hypothetical protein